MPKYAATGINNTNNIILKTELKSTDGAKFEAVGWWELEYDDEPPRDEKAELILAKIPIKKVNINTIPHNTTAKMLPRYIEKFGKTYDLSSHPAYPANIPPKNTANTTVNKTYVIMSIEPFARNEDHTIDPANRNTPKITKENMIIE